jgi:TIR domain
MTAHVFISYSHNDQLRAQRIYNALARARIPAFIDLVGLLPGQSLTATIGKAIESAKAVIPIISKSSVDSDWVRSELIACKKLGISIIPFRSDDVSLPIQLRLILEDILYIEGSDPFYAEGLTPKIVAHLLPATNNIEDGHFFEIGAEERSAPRVQCFFGTVNRAWDELRFGRTAIVLPTNEGVNLGGRATTSILEHLGIAAASLIPVRPTISSRHVSLLTNQPPATDDLLLIASTVFNSKGEPHAEDQWRAAEAILECTERQKCTLVLVPPLGTGTFDWPVRQAVVNWLYGAIRWYRTNATATAKSVWPVLCVPGPGDQKIMSNYLKGLTRDRLAGLLDGKLTLKLRYHGEVSDEFRMSHDVLLGSIARSAFPNLKTAARLRFRHGARLIMRSSRRLFDYDADTPLAHTIFADDDIIEAYSVD